MYKYVHICGSNLLIEQLINLSVLAQVSDVLQRCFQHLHVCQNQSRIGK